MIGAESGWLSVGHRACANVQVDVFRLNSVGDQRASSDIHHNLLVGLVGDLQKHFGAERRAVENIPEHAPVPVFAPAPVGFNGQPVSGYPSLYTAGFIAGDRHLRLVLRPRLYRELVRPDISPYAGEAVCYVVGVCAATAVPTSPRTARRYGPKTR